MDFSVTEEARESYRPDSAVVRSEQTSEDLTRNGSGGAAQGIPGATSNQPAAAAPAKPADPNAKKDTNAAATASASAANDGPLSQSRTSSRNYELDRTVSHTRQPVGRLKRLSVAVLVDNLSKTDQKSGKTATTALTQEQLTRVEALVKEAVGFSAERGDSVVVQNASFIAPEVPNLAPLPLWQRPELRDYARQGLGGLVLLVLILAVLRPLLKSLMAPPRRVALPGEAPLQAELLGDQLSLGGPAKGGTPAYEQKLAVARGAVNQDPKRVAQVVKTWLGEDG